MANADRCICCGEIVPEGRQICPHKAEDDSFSNVELQLCGSNDKENPRTEITVKEI